MIKLTILALLLIITSFNIYAKDIHGEYYDDGKKYILVKDEANAYLQGYVGFLKDLNECKPSVFKYYNPLINQSGKYEIFGKNSNNKCILYLNYNQLREFKCNLEKSDINKILTGRIKLIKSKSGFGELSDSEKSVYFNKNTCERAVIDKNKTKEVSLEELKKTIDDPEMLQFLQLFGDKK